MLNKLKSNYEELQIKPSVDLWSRLENELDKKTEIVLKPAFQWWRYAAIVLLFISVGSIIYFKDKNEFNYKKKDYMMKNVLEETDIPLNPEFESIPFSDKKEIKSTDENNIVVFKENKTKKAKTGEKQEIIQTYYPVEYKLSLANEKNINLKNSLDADIIQEKDINQIMEKPILAEKNKANYISADELLLGREFDKTRKKSNENGIKFGVFNFDKPKVENVTVLGVTVYIDSE